MRRPRSRVVVSPAESARVRKYVARVGHVRALSSLGIGDEVLRSALDCGHMLRATRERVFAALEREEGAS